MPIVDSEALLAVDYDADRKVLRATFRGTGKTYDYVDVPVETYAALMAAESRGVWFNENVRDRFRFRRVSGPLRII